MTDFIRCTAAHGLARLASLALLGSAACGAGSTVPDDAPKSIIGQEYQMVAVWSTQRTLGLRPLPTVTCSYYGPQDNTWTVSGTLTFAPDSAIQLVNFRWQYDEYPHIDTSFQRRQAIPYSYSRQDGAYRLSTVGNPTLTDGVADTLEISQVYSSTSQIPTPGHPVALCRNSPVVFVFLRRH